jgi:hypothetical protein
MNRLEVVAGFALLGYGVWRLVVLLLALSSLGSGNLLIVGLAPIISLRALEESIVTVWATSLAGIALLVDGLHRGHSSPTELLHAGDLTESPAR